MVPDVLVDKRVLRDASLSSSIVDVRQESRTVCKVAIRVVQRSRL